MVVTFCTREATRVRSPDTKAWGERQPAKPRRVPHLSRSSASGAFGRSPWARPGVHHDPAPHGRGRPRGSRTMWGPWVTLCNSLQPATPTVFRKFFGLFFGDTRSPAMKSRTSPLNPLSYHPRTRNGRFGKRAVGSLGWLQTSSCEYVPTNATYSISEGRD